MHPLFRSLRLVFAAAIAACALLASCATVSQAPVAAAPTSPAVLKVACIGDSITYGYGIDPIYQSYPAVLGDLLGESWEVQNFGVNSTTVLSKGDTPYVKSSMYAESLKSDPQVVIIMLGTNDTKYTNFQYSDDFVPDYEALIATYRKLPSHPVVLIATPAWVVGDGNWGINDQCLVEEQIPMILDMAKRLNVHVVDIHEVTKDHPELYLEDFVHPNAKGAELLAQTFQKAVLAQEKTLRK